MKANYIVNNLVPLEENKKDYTGLGSEVELDFHIENAALKFITGLNLSPKGILLSGVRNDVDGPLTRISDARLALKLLSEEDLSSLRDNLYIMNVPYRWRKNEVTSTSKVPLIQGDGEFPNISAVFYPCMLEPQSKKATEALDHFMKLLRLYLLELMYNQEDYYTLITEWLYTLEINFLDHLIVMKIQCGEFKECLCLQIYRIIDM